MAQTKANVIAARLGVWAPWVVIALIATTAGLVLPQLMPGETVLPKSAARVDSKEKGSLEYQAPTMPESPDFQGMMLRLGLGTVLVLGLSVSTLWGMRRWLSPIDAIAGTRQMRLLETLNLGNRCCLHLVHLGKRELIVGVDAGGIKSVLPITEAFDEILAGTAEEDKPETPPAKAAA